MDLFETILEEGIMSRITGVGSAFPPNAFTQDEVRQLLGVTNPTVLKLLSAPHIQKRSLYFDRDPTKSGQKQPCEPMKRESTKKLHDKFISGLCDIGVQAALKSMSCSGTTASDIDVVVAVTSSGLALPGFSAILVRELGLRGDVRRNDIVGMGCNAGMTGLQSLNSFVRELSRKLHRPIKGLLVCCEVNSAIYVNDNSTSKGIVNSLFGDGAAALVVETELLDMPMETPMTLAQEPHLSPINADGESRMQKIALVDFTTCTVPNHFDDMIYYVDPEAQQLNFKLSKKIPFVVGEQAPSVVKSLLKKNNLGPSDVCHWIVHAGGAKVMDGFAESLGLNKAVDMRHTVSVLRDYGNLSSGSFIVSFDRFIQESQNKVGVDNVVCEGDIVVFVAMGPGMTIEAGLGIVSNGSPSTRSDLSLYRRESELSEASTKVLEPPKVKNDQDFTINEASPSFCWRTSLIWLQLYAFIKIGTFILSSLFQDSWWTSVSSQQILGETSVTGLALQCIALPIMLCIFRKFNSFHDLPTGPRPEIVMPQPLQHHCDPCINDHSVPPLAPLRCRIGEHHRDGGVLRRREAML